MLATTAHNLDRDLRNAFALEFAGNVEIQGRPLLFEEKRAQVIPVSKTEVSAG